MTAEKDHRLDALLLEGAFDKNGQQLRAGDLVAKSNPSPDRDEILFRELRALIVGHGMVLAGKTANTQELARTARSESVLLEELAAMKLVQESRKMTNTHELVAIQQRISRDLRFASMMSSAPDLLK